MDQLLEKAGAFGKLQKISLIIIGSLTIIPSLSLYVTLFNTAEPELKCKSLHTTNEHTKLCDMWNNYTSSVAQNQTNFYTCKFDDKYYGQTIINDWELVCDKQYLAGLTQSFYLCGFISAFVGGILSDKYGRKRITSIFVLLFAVASLVFNVLMINLNSFELSISSRLNIYNIFQLLSGIFSTGIWNSAYVLLIELTNDEYHTLVSNVNIFFYVFGELLIMGAYYASKNWRITNWFLTIYSTIVFLPFVYFVPESPRYFNSYQFL